MLLRAATALPALLLGCTGERAPASEAGPAVDVQAAQAAPPALPWLVDDFGDTVWIGAAPARIASLNPATTELLFAIGAGHLLVGRTTWDNWPAEARAVADLGPGIRPNVEAVLGVAPQLVLLYASEDNRAAAARLRSLGIATASFRVDRIADFERVTLALGALTGHRDRAGTVVDTVSRTLTRVRSATASAPRVSLVIPLWDAPLLVAGGGSFLTELVELAGGRNVYGSLAAPSPQVSFEDLLQRDPDAVLAGPVAARRYETDPRWRTLRAVREGRVLAVDTMLVLRPGARLGEAARSIAARLHPALVR